MTIQEALDIVIELAAQNMCDPFELPGEHARQEKAINMVAAFRSYIEQK